MIMFFVVIKILCDIWVVVNGVTLEFTHFLCLRTIIGLDLCIRRDIFDDEDAIAAEDGVRLSLRRLVNEHGDSESP